MDEDSASREPKKEQNLALYAGRWVALAGDQVAGVGDTAVAAERLGRRNRLRERLAVYYVEPEGGRLLSLPELMDQLRPIFRRHNQPVHLVGGAVRDVLLGRRIKDLDFVVPEGAIRLAFKVADDLQLPAYILDRERDAGRVVLPDGETTLDFACYRGEDLLADLRARDFTINAMALPVAAQTQASVVDPCDGEADLQARLIRLAYPSAVKEDPVRALRAVRHANDFSFAIEDETREAIHRSATLLNRVSVERVRDELLKMLQAPMPGENVRMMADLGLLRGVLPEIAALADLPQTLPHFEPVLAHTLRVLGILPQIEALVAIDPSPAGEYLAEAQQVLGPYRKQLGEHLERKLDGGVYGRQVLRLGALFHDAGKVESMSVELDGRIRFVGHAEKGAKIAGHRLAKLRLSREVIRHSAAIVGGHMRPLLLARNPQLTRRAVFRFYRDIGDAGLDITLLAMADQLALIEGGEAVSQWRRLLGVVEQLLRHYFEHFAETVQPTPLLDGREMQALLRIEPGPEIGRLLRLLQEAQAAGEVKSRDEAVALVIELAAGRSA